MNKIEPNQSLGDCGSLHIFDTHILILCSKYNKLKNAVIMNIRIFVPSIVIRFDITNVRLYFETTKFLLMFYTKRTGIKANNKNRYNRAKDSHNNNG